MSAELFRELLCRMVTLRGDLRLLPYLAVHMCRVPRLVVMMAGDVWFYRTYALLRPSSNFILL